MKQKTNSEPSNYKIVFHNYSPTPTENLKSVIPFACTSLIIKDKNNNIYHGRGMEFTTDQVTSSLTYYPRGQVFQYNSPDKTPGLKYVSKYSILAMTDPVNSEITRAATEGMNDAGLCFSLNMIHTSTLHDPEPSEYSKTVPFICFGEWALANFATVEDLKVGLKDVVFWAEGLALLGGLKAPFHFAVYDKKGGSIVVEISEGILHIYDNPTGVLTNGPEFPWHLENLNNYTHLSNIDVSTAQIGAMTLRQPDSGISSSALPSSATSVGRFIKAFHYASFANQVDDPDTQIAELGHIMNNFDRPKNINKDLTGEGEQSAEKKYLTEFTVWTVLADLSRGHFYVRMYGSLNYEKFTFDQFKDKTELTSIPLKK